MCQNSCNECPKKIFSTAVAVNTINSVDTLIISIPQQTFRNCERGCLVIVQSIPTAATINMPVAIAIGDDTTTVYPLVDGNCDTVTPCMLRTRRRYPFKIATNITGGTFKILRNLSCGPGGNLTTIPQT